MSILNMNSELLKVMSEMIGDLVSKAVRHCGEVHNFDAEEMLRSMNVWDVGVEKKDKKCLSFGVKSKMPMPFSGKVKENCCGGLRQNHGLYTQCETVVKDEKYCKKCGENPEYGTIEQRLEAGLMEFRDPKGKAPTHFTKVMKKLKISREEVEEEASKLNIIINDIHFEEEKVEKKEKGRPKKPKRRIELADDSTDLFAALVAKANEDSEESGSSSEDEKLSIAENIIDSVLDKVSVIAENNEKEALKQAEKEKKEAEKEALKQAEKEKKEAEKEALKQAEKEKKEAEKEALKQAEKEKKEAEKEALKQAEIQKKEALKAEKEALKQAEIQKKEALKQAEIQKKAEKEAEKQKKEAEKAEKEALKQAEKQKKEEEKLKKESTQASKVVKPKKESVETVAVSVVAEKKASKAAVKEVEEEQEDVVKRFEFEGIKYLKSKKTGIIYNMDQDVIGKWNEKTGKIDFEEAGSEEEEEEYDE